MDFRLPPVTKKPDAFNRVKQYFIIILNIAFTKIYNDILDKGVTKGNSFKLIRL